MLKKKFRSLSFYYIHRILTQCLLIDEESNEYYYISSTNQLYKKTSATTLILKYIFDENIQDDIFLIISKIAKSARQTIIFTLRKVYEMLVDRYSENAMINQLILKINSTIQYNQIQVLFKYISYYDDSYDTYKILQYVASVMNYGDKKLAILLTKLCTIKQLENVILKFKIKPNTFIVQYLKWMRISPLYAAVIRRDRSSPIHRITLDALGEVMSKY